MYAITPATLLALASSIALIDTLAPVASSVQATGYGAPVLYCGPKFNNAHCPTGSCCSAHGTCGNTKMHCVKKCDALFGCCGEKNVGGSATGTHYPGGNGSTTHKGEGSGMGTGMHTGGEGSGMGTGMHTGGEGSGMGTGMHTGGEGGDGGSISGGNNTAICTFPNGTLVQNITSIDITDPLFNITCDNTTGFVNATARRAIPKPSGASSSMVEKATGMALFSATAMVVSALCF